MISAFLPLVFSVVTGLTPAPDSAPAAAPEPAVRVTLNHQTYNRGDRARVTVRVRDDGYVVVLHADANGRVRVLFPVDPGDDNFMKGGQDYEIRGRGDRDAFQVTSTGAGTVYAAVSMDPMHFDDFARNSHWDYEKLEGDSASSDNTEAQLTNIVEQMADGSHFDYDLATYTVESAYASNDRAYIVPGGAYGCIYDAFDPWCGGYYPYPSYYGGFGVDIAFGFGGFWGYRPYGYGYGYPRYGFGYGFGGGYYIPRGYGAAGYGYKVGRGWSYNHRPIVLGPGGGYTVGRGFGLGAGLGALNVAYHNRGGSLVGVRGDGFRTRINDRPSSAVGGTRVMPREGGRIATGDRVQARGESRGTRVEQRSEPRGERAPQHESRGGGERRSGGGGGGGERRSGGGGGGGGHHGGGGGGGGGRRH